ncbi:MAG: hypothetical protein M1370_02280 [Bacteroidetes bacterium]|nr:hypothetical protein [Bacteroidota bacterium]MCL5025083.1 hypothetical protein [Chloroflexota bacterium]
MGGRQGRESRLNKEQYDQLVQQATQGNFHTIGEAAKWVEQTYGVHYTYFGMRSLVERLSIGRFLGQLV